MNSVTYTPSNFREDGPFFPYVNSILTAIASSSGVFDPGNLLALTEEHRIDIGGAKVGLRNLWPLQIYRNVQGGFVSQKEYWTHLGVMLTNTSYEAIRDQADGSPLFEYFRHIRNASSHGNRFNFNENEPKLPAEWRGHSFDERLKGNRNPLFGTKCFGEYFWIADILQLLWDVEQILIQKPIQGSRQGE